MNEIIECMFCSKAGIELRKRKMYHLCNTGINKETVFTHGAFICKNCGRITLIEMNEPRVIKFITRKDKQ